MPVEALEIEGSESARTEEDTSQPRRQLRTRALLIGLFFGASLGGLAFLYLRLPPDPRLWFGRTPATGCSEGYKALTRYSAVEGSAGEEPPPVAAPLGAAPPDVSKPGVGVEGVKTWARSRTLQAHAEHVGPYFPSPTDWASSVIYNIVVDRFNNGDSSNDKANVDKQQEEDLQNGRYRADMRHGGDLEGVRKRLPYLKDLGINVIWMTPVFEHNGAYHGYCTTDPTQVDPGFGTKELLRDLVREAHDLDIRVVVDVVVNHLCDKDTMYVHQRPAGDPEVAACANHFEQMHWDGEEGNPSEQVAVMFSDHFFPPFKSQVFFNRCGSNSPQTMSGDQPIAVYGDFVDGMFDYNTRDRDFQQIFTELMNFWIAYADVDGFRMDAAKHVTEDFVAYFSTKVRLYAESIGKANFFIVGEVAANVDWQARRLGLMASDPQDPNRLDAEFSMPRTVTKALVDLKADFQRHGSFKMPGMDSVYNFYLSGKGKAALQGVDDNGNKAYVGSLGSYLQDHLSELSSVAGQLHDCCATSIEGCTPQLPKLWTLLEIHDWPRFAAKFPSDSKLAEVGFVWLFTMPGQPIIYYGQEQGFNNQCPESDHVDAGPAGTQEVLRECAGMREKPGTHDDILHPYFRQDMYTAGPLQLGSVVPSVDARKSIDISKLTADPPELFKGPWNEDPLLDRSHQLYQLARKLTRLRSSCPALVVGRTVWGIAGYDGRGPRAVMVYSRVLKDTEVVVVINPASTDAVFDEFECEPSINEQGYVYRDVLDPDPKEVYRVSIREGRCFLGPGADNHKNGVVEAYKTRILIREDKLFKEGGGGVVYHEGCDNIALCAESYSEELCLPPVEQAEPSEQPTS